MTRKVRSIILLAAFILSAAFPAQDGLAAASGFDVQGHRGARGLKPENTLPAFETALDVGVTTLELDLHFTVDGVVVIWHDDAVVSEKCRLDENTSVDVPGFDAGLAALLISNLTYEQVQAFICDLNPDPGRFPDQNNMPTPLAGDNYRIISLDDLFVFVDSYAEAEGKSEAQRDTARRVQFNIETKRKPEFPQAINDDFDGVHAGPFELAILEIVEQHGLDNRVIVQSFDHRSLWAMRAQNESIRLAALTNRTRPDIADYVAQGATIWSPDFLSLRPDDLDAAHEAGLLVIPWTVNDAGAMHDLIDMGVDGIITDRPDILLDAVKAD